MDLSANKLRSSMCWLRQLLETCEVATEHKQFMEDFINKNSPMNNEQAQQRTDLLFTFLSDCVRQDKYTLEIAVAFEEYLMLILTEALIEHAEETFTDYQRKCVALSKMMQCSVQVKQYASSYFRTKPAPFEVDAVAPKSKKNKTEQKLAAVAALELARCCYRFLRTDLAYFKELWNWSSFLERYCAKSQQNRFDLLQLYCNHIVALLTQMTPKQLHELCREIPAKVWLKFDAEQDIKSGIPTINPFHKQDFGHELFTYKIKPNLAITNIEGVLLPIYSQVNYKFYAKNDGVYDTIVQVDSTKVNLRSIALGVSASKAICLSGPVGCGKTTLVEYLARKTGRICPKAKEVENAEKLDKENSSVNVKLNGKSKKRKNETFNEAKIKEDQQNTKGFLRIQLGDQTDSKMLLGQYRCTDVPGEFIWLPGVLTQAVMHGYWLLLEDLDAATQDTYTILSSLLEHKFLSVPGFRDCVKIAPGFQLFVTVRTNKSATNSAQKSLYTLLEKYLYTVNILPLSRNELCKVVSSNYPKLATVANRIVDVFLTFSSGDHAAADNLRQQETADKADTTEKYIALPFEQVSLTSVANSGRLVSTRDLIKLCQRSNPVFSVTSTECAYFVFQNAVDVFCSYLPQSKEKTKLIISIGAKLGIIQSRCEHFAEEYRPEVQVDSELIKVGRATLETKSMNELNSTYIDNNEELLSNKRQKLSETTAKSLKTYQLSTKTTFSYTRLAVCILERIAVSVAHAEPVLLVGETGVGKTSSVQFLAASTQHKLVVVNMNNQSDVSDLVGGFKPVDLTYVLLPLRTEFEQLFRSTFNELKNAQFLQKYAICYNQSNFEVVVKLMLKVAQNFMEKHQKQQLGAKQLELLPRWQNLLTKVSKLNAQLSKSVNISFAFIPGSLVNCIKNGDWVLLDEINLASAETLECLSTILEPAGSVVLLEKGDFEPVKRHADFRIFACMNPNTDIGKKDLPIGIRNRFTEFFVDELTTDADLNLLVRDYLANTGIQSKHVSNIVKLYKKLKQMSKLELNDGLGNRPVYSLRTLCRALSICAKNLCGSIERNLYESFCLSFLTQLDNDSHALVLQYIQTALVGNVKQVLRQSIPKPGDNYLNFEGYWIQAGTQPLQACESYILTASVKQNLADLARIIAIGKLPVLLQGPTSAGKTSLIEYVAKKSGNHCLRINNHEHTDLQEYIGTYAADTTGKLSFREGVLVQAMRHGYWIILDELNLASTDILEALNRVLDDNRELYIAETQTVVKAHANFMLFATQNPPGLYGGRKTLSRAFKNRFIELHFNNIPRAELEIILKQRCLIPASYAKKMVSCMSDLQKNRKTTSKNVFTLRDLFRWGNRYTYADKSLLTDEQYDWNQHLIEEGYLVLSAKVRTAVEIEIIEAALYANFRKRINLHKLYDIQAETASPVTASILADIKAFKQRTDIVWTMNMTRMAVLTAKALQFNEPVLLVGPTGCGKTTVCQLLASMRGVKLSILNCHMHTEGADFLGGLRPCRERGQQGKLFEWADGPLITAMQQGSYFMADEISLAEDSVLERLNCILEPERTVLLAEKGGMVAQEANLCDEFVVRAADGFQFLATMNPGGDFGKKELSPALRNRFTEIWCLPSDAKEDLIQIASNCILEQQLMADKQTVLKTASFLVEVVLYIKQQLEKFKFSVRDILAWANYMVSNAHLSFPERAIFGLETIFLDALEMLPHESLENVEILKAKIIKYAIKQAGLIMQENFTQQQVAAKRGVTVISQANKFGISPFFIPINTAATKSAIVRTFMFEAPTTKQNLFRLLSALSLQKPVLLEGPPGVGKTSIVESLASAVGCNIVRINLCEHTDLADLFGTDLPAEDNVLDADTSDSLIGAFVWRDGPLLAALKAPHTWILLDELNLAPQSVLEGLNAILDHRGEVFIPELNRSFALSKETRIFACQNPLKQGGGRKGLPQSFLNRFNKVYLRKLSTADLHYVIDSQYSKFFEQLKNKLLSFLPESCPAADNLFDLYQALKTKHNASLAISDLSLLKLDLAQRLVSFSERLDAGIADMQFGFRGGPFEINLRDILRWCELLAHAETGIKFSSTHTNFEMHFEQFLLTLYERMKLVYYQRMRCEQDKAFIRNTFASVFNCDAEALQQLSADVSLYWTDEHVYLNDIVLSRSGSMSALRQQTAETTPLLLQSQREVLQQLAECLHLQKPVLLCGGNDTGKTKLVDAICALTQQTCNTDTIDDSVTGSFQQIDLNRHLEQIAQQVEVILLSNMQKFILAEGNMLAACNLLNAWSKYNALAKSMPAADNNNVSVMTQELQIFKQRLSNLLQVVESLSKTCQQNASVLQQQQQLLSSLQQHVRQAESLNTGGSFEWVDSKIVQSLKQGTYLLLEHVNLCSSAILDRLNPVFEPNGSLLISEKGVSAHESAEIVKQAANFRAFLTIDPKNGELSRAMRNRCVELALSKEDAYEQQDLRQIIYAEGVQHVGAIACILSIHQRMCQLSEINNFSVSHLTRVAFLVSSYKRIGYDLERALYVAAMEVYVYAAHADLLGFGLAYYQNQLREIVLTETQNFDSTLEQTVNLSEVLLDCSNLHALSFIKQQVAPLKLLLQQQQLSLLSSDFAEFELILQQRNEQQLLSFYVFVLYESSSVEDLEMRHLVLKQLLNGDLQNYAKLLYKCIVNFASKLPKYAGKLPWHCELLPRLRVHALSLKAEDVVNCYALSATLLLQALVQPLPVVAVWPNLQNIQAVQYSQLVKQHIRTDKLNNEFLLSLSTFVEGLYSLLQAGLPLATLNLNVYAQLITACLWYNRFVQVAQQKLYVDKLLNTELLDKLLLHFKWLQKHLLQLLRKILPANCFEQAVSFRESLAKMEAHVLKVKPPLNMMKKMYCKKMTHFQPYYQQQQIDVHNLAQQLDEVLNVIPVYGTFSANLILHKYAAQQTVSAQRAKAQLSNYTYAALDYHFKSVQLAESEAGSLRLELRQKIQKFLSELAENENSTQLQITAEDFHTLNSDVSALQQQITAHLDTQESDELEQFVALQDIELRLLPLREYLLTKAINAQFNKQNAAEINTYFYEQIPTLSCATLQCLKMLNSHKFTSFQQIWQEMSTSDWQHLNSYLNGSYRDFATFARLLQNANYRQQLHNLSTRVQCTHVLQQRDLEINSRYVFEGPALTNALLAMLCNVDGKLKSMPMQDLHSWRTALSQTQQLLWQNVQLMTQKYALNENNMQLALQNAQRLLQEVRFVQNCLPNSTNNDDFQTGFNALVTRLAAQLEHTPSASEQPFHCGFLHALVGSLEMCLLSYTPLIDPVEKQRLQQLYIKQNIDTIENLQGAYDMMRIVLHYQHYAQNSYTALTAHLQHLIQRSYKYASKVALRPQKCQYAQLAHEIAHFMHTNCEPQRFMNLLLSAETAWQTLQSVELSSESLASVVEVLSKLQLWIDNSQRFVNHSLKCYSAYYEDFLQPLQCAINQLCFGFENLIINLTQLHAAFRQTESRQLCLNLNHEERLQNALLNIVAFPSAQKLQIFEQNRTDIFAILSPLKHSEQAYLQLLQAKLMEIQQLCKINSTLAEKDFQALDFVLNICNQVWQKEEQRRCALKAEQDSLYVQKTHCAEENEELVELQEIAQHFPADVEQDFAEFVVQDTLEKVMKLQQNDVKSKPTDMLSEEQYAFLAQNFIDLMLQHTNAYYYKPPTAIDTDISLLSAFEKRLQVFVQLFAQYKTALNENLDLSAFNSCALAVNLQQQLLQEQPHDKQHVYNYYKDANIAEISSCNDVLKAIERRVEEQLELYPEHATLQDILRIITRIRQLPANATLVRFNMGFQLLRQKVAQWNEIAHKGNNLREEEVLLAEHVQRWTRLELQCWRNCLQQTDTQMSSQAYRYWFFIYNLLQEYLAQHEVDLSLRDMKTAEKRFIDGEVEQQTTATKVALTDVLRILRQFVESSNFGDFQVRVRLLQAFELYLHNMQQHLSANALLTDLIAGLRNLHIYFAQFFKEIEETRKLMRSPIEKKLKEFVKIESYNKDLSYFSMRNNIARVHRQLNKFLREYRTQLQEKVTRVFQVRDATAQDYQFSGDKGKQLRYESSIKYFMLPERQFVAALKLRQQYIGEVETHNKQTLISRVATLFNNSRQVVKSTVKNAKYPQLILSLDDVFQGQLARCEHLRNLSVDRSKEKPQQKVQAKQILQQKRKALIDLFKQLAQLGISYKSGLMEMSLGNEFVDFKLTPFCIETMLMPGKPKALQTTLQQLNQNLDNYFAKCVFKLQLLQNVMLTPLSELGPPTIDRIKGSSVDLFLLVQKQRALLADSCKNMYDLRLSLQQIREIAEVNEQQVSEEQLNFSKSRDKFVALRANLCRMRFVFEQLILLLNGAPARLNKEAQVFENMQLMLLKNTTEFEELQSSCQRILQLSKDTLQNMQKNEQEFVSHVKITAYQNTHDKLVGMIEQVKQSLTMCADHLPLAQPLLDLLALSEKSQDLQVKLETPVIDLTEVEAALEQVLHAVLLALQKLYKKYPEQERSRSTTPKSSPNKENVEEEQENDDIKEQHLRKELMEELQLDWKILNLPHILTQLSHILLTLKHAPANEQKLQHCRQVVTMLPLLEQYQLMADYYLFQQLGMHKVSVKLLSVLLTVFVEIGTKGFCVPPDLMQDDDGEKGGEQKDGEGFGLEDGTGEKDASDKLESEDQLDDAKRPEDRKDQEDKEDPDCKEEKGIEMSDDFDGKMQDVEKPENEEDDSGESEDEDELNKEMGETEENAEKLDDQIWGDDEEPEPEEEEEKDMEEETGKGSKDEKDAHNDLDTKNDAAKEDGQNEEEKEGLDATEEPSGEDKRKKQEKDIDQMKDQEGDEEEQANPYHNELEEPPEPEDMDLGDMNNDKNEEHEEGEEPQGDDNPFDIDRMKENMQITEEEVDPNEDEKAEEVDEEHKDQADSDASDSEDEAVEDLKDDKQDDKPEGENAEEQADEEAEKQKRAEPEVEEEKQVEGEEKREEKPEDHAQSKDKSTIEENAQTVPETEEKASADQVENEKNNKDVKQEDKLDEQDTGEEKDGVGQAENEEQDGGHKGVAETKETTAREDSKNERKPEEKRKQGKTDEDRTLGEAEKNKLKKLKTIDKLREENEKNEQETEKEQDEDVDMEAEEYQHVKEPKNKDKTTLDNATEEQSKQIKPLEEEKEEKTEEAEESENAEDMQVDEDEMNDKEKEELEQIEVNKTEEKSDKPSKSDKHKERAETQQQEEIEVEGEYTLTMDVPRGTDTTAHAMKDVLLDNSQAEELSAAETLELRRQYQQQVTTNLAVRAEHADHETWQTVSQRMAQSARDLCEQLRLILEPTKCTRLKGDYRTGRRINMKKIIPYIASQFRKDKIWLRRTKPAQRDYKITIAIDDSKSMHHNNSKTLTLEAISLISQALTLLESGRLSVISFGERVQIVLNHTEQFDGPKLVNALNFDQDKTKIAELLDFVRTMNTEEGLGGSDNGLFENLLLILSDGRNIFGEGKLRMKNAIKLARLQRIFLVYIIIDNPENKNSILDIQTMEMLPDTRISIKSYLDDFPFPYYVIVRDLNQLPLVLSEAMRQWFELVNSEQ